MNFRQVLSKASLTSSSKKSLAISGEAIKLQTQIEKWKQTVNSLKMTLESRGEAIGTLAREKEKLYVELKSVQRRNRNLQQQLDDERFTTRSLM
jgi:chromosome segregation ATPase